MQGNGPARGGRPGAGTTEERRRTTVKRSILAWVLVLALALGLPAWAFAAGPEAVAVQVPAEASEAEASREAREADFAARREAARTSSPG